MRHHAYFYAGDLEEGIQAAKRFTKEMLSLEGDTNPDLLILRYPLFSVDDARFVSEVASRAPVEGDTRALVISAGRIFHEAQNALLKTFEEPTPGTYLILIVPSEGNIIETLRSRLLPLPGTEHTVSISPLATQFVDGTLAAREKVIEQILDQAKSDDAEEKQAARLEALRLAEGIAKRAYASARTKETLALLADLTRLIPILHERSAPLKPILEHLMLVMPQRLDK